MAFTDLLRRAYSIGASTVAFLTTDFFAAVFLWVAFFVAEGSGFSFAASTAAQRLRAASAIVFLPTSLIFRFGLGDTVTGVDGSDAPRIFAHRRCWASLILRRVAAENFRRLGRVPFGLAAGSAGRPFGMARSSAILLCLEACYCSCDDFVCEFCRHVGVSVCCKSFNIILSQESTANPVRVRFNDRVSRF